MGDGGFLLQEDVMRRTRIVATLGPATDRPGVLEQLLAAGLDVARINFSHGSPAEHERRIHSLRQLASQLGRDVAVLADLPGPKLRVLLQAPVTFKPGDVCSLGLGGPEGCHLSVTEPEALRRVQPGQRVLFDDGRLQAKVTQVEKDHLLMGFEAGGILQPNKGLNLPDSDLAIPAVTGRDREALATALAAGVDWVALSFVRDADAAEELRAVLREQGRPNLPILAKMERPEAVARAEDIVHAFDGIMVARGDLGVEIPLETVPHVQKSLITMARKAAKPVITATDMLDSMRHNPRPTRAEASDVANAVYDGTDAVMLSGETAIGDHPVQAFECMQRILIEAERHQLDDSPRGLAVPKGELIDHITHLTFDLARHAAARAIVAPTLTGRTARLIARHRPAASIVAVSSSEEVVRRLALVWGVNAVLYPAPVMKGDDRMAAAVRAAFARGVIQCGDRVVVLAGHPIEGAEGLPTIRVAQVGEAGRSCAP